ncbi:MAG: iron ABC transporter permease [Alphaproteobacteria bacterium]|nr:iron ABC transporter permease [Alphaproteobacteria bacterium]
MRRPRRRRRAGAPGSGGRVLTVAAASASGSGEGVRGRARLLGLLIVLIVTIGVLSLVTDAQGHPGLDVFGHGALAPELARTILLEVRLPRACLALLVGASLGLAGAALQGLTRNPLAEPGLIGTSTAAAFGAVLAFYFGLAGASSLGLPLGGIAGAALALALLMRVAGRDRPTATLMLAGMALNALFGALTALALNLAPNPFAVTEVVFWMMGSFADRSLAHVVLVAPFLLAGAVLLAATSRGLDALSLGEEAAASLGVSLPRLRLLVLAGCGLTVGAATSVAGVIGFVGLVVPHIMRSLVGARPSGLLLPSALGGAVLLGGADLLARFFSGTTELKVGVVTAVVGAPFFLWMLLSERESVSG